MKLSTLSPREQVIVMIVVTVLFLFIYGFFRLTPLLKEQSALNRQITQLERKLAKARVPDEPDEGLESLVRQLEEQEKTLALLQGMSEKVMNSLAPEGSQELKVMISQLASDNKIRIIKNESFLPPATSPLRLHKPQNKKRKQVKPSSAKALPATYNWIQRMAPGTPFYRPMQRLVLHCDYPSLRQFIHQLSSLPWQVTVIRLKIEKLPIQPLRGTTQGLQAELILAL